MMPCRTWAWAKAVVPEMPFSKPAGTHAGIETLRHVPLFSELSPSELEQVATLSSPRSCRRGETIFLENDPGDALYIIQSGLVRIYRVAEDGREKTLAILTDGDFFGEMALMDEMPRSAVAQAREPTQLLAIHKQDFERLLAQNPHLSRAIITSLSRRLRAANEQLLGAVFLDVRERVHRILKVLAAEHGHPHPGGGRIIGLRLTHQELANLAGTSRETVTRVLAEMQDEGLIRWQDRRLVLTTRGIDDG